MRLGENVWEEGVGKEKEQNLDQTSFFYWVQTFFFFFFLYVWKKEPESESREVEQWGVEHWFTNFHLPLQGGPSDGMDMQCGSIQTNHLKEKASSVILGNSLFSHEVPFSANICM